MDLSIFLRQYFLAFAARTTKKKIRWESSKENNFPVSTFIAFKIKKNIFYVLY